jgi:hypothetical protein
MVIPVGDICDSDRCLLGTMSPVSHVAKPQAGDIWRHLSPMSPMSPQRGDVKLTQPRSRRALRPEFFIAPRFAAEVGLASLLVAARFAPALCWPPRRYCGVSRLLYGEARPYVEECGKGFDKGGIDRAPTIFRRLSASESATGLAPLFTGPSEKAPSSIYPTIR